MILIIVLLEVVHFRRLLIFLTSPILLSPWAAVQGGGLPAADWHGEAVPPGGAAAEESVRPDRQGHDPGAADWAPTPLGQPGG